MNEVIIQGPKGFSAPELRPRKRRAPGLEDEKFRALDLELHHSKFHRSIVSSLQVINIITIIIIIVPLQSSICPESAFLSQGPTTKIWGLQDSKDPLWGP